MTLSEELLRIVPEASFVPIVTVSGTGVPHAIAVGKIKEVREGSTFVFGIYKMNTTQNNIRDNGKMQVLLVSRQQGSKGFRLTGKACVEDKEVLFSPETVESLL
jgi:predicted pyridoxine 5'-phosphate oxidase superfamily flavin-nucleotide-binding protein